MDECDDQAETITFLSRAATYGLAGPVERIDTHAAIVFLAGEHAFKLKRAVRYPYLDFSTAEKRRAVCEAELALNRRTAPEIYRDVRPVGRLDDGRLALGAGTPVDWLVVMRRFASECLLDTMARKGPLPPSLIRDLADEIAAFHDKAETVPGPGAERVRRVIEGNRASMVALAQGLLPANDCDLLHDRSIAALEALSPLLDRRADSGHVKHCHGDLHLANICLWHGRPTLFDCLEFDPELATTDVLYDLAFLLMDLWQRDLHAEASLTFNRYCDMRDERDGLAAMPLFLSMRAAVRAHVSASAAERQANAAQRADKRRAACDYLATALAMLDRPGPRLIAIGGLSGTGKSTLAGHLAPRIGAAPGARWLRSDVLRKRLAGVRPEDRLSADAYTKERGHEVYRKLTQDARGALAAGMNVIVDAVFADPAERAAIADVAASCGVPFTGLWLEAPPEVMRTRVDTRKADASDADSAVVDRQLDYALGDLGAWRRTNAAGTPDEVLAEALRHIDETLG
ncbi:AAA family ATPase [Novosphingobium mangrovi (ex Huang et al. 2023)]|uniref:AAA family ATPase n=1 Tax=Novosphingobium mangrovi (ex Huang et al. 2023) TaxID=2976432 RepID=A0ABT2I1F4_9SPHN|nr:bifunctional aminoglycoside phosphotransferase/ATP-binding protein [Novosphingobium mangrovi (ex Huang et al. 2023)]MCT2398442.1 AAA family ATPase [Novosphingobium mangrovi (ex Huang et al. 2023)]